MQGNKLNRQLQRCLEAFPMPVRKSLHTIRDNGGMLSAEHCLDIMESLEISDDILMQRLLPLAQLYSVAAVSHFQVGAVAKARMSDNAEDFALFTGANIEFSAQALTQVIHAEQSATVNAWLQGAKHIDSLAVTAAPCGYCRQFLYELEESQNLKVLIFDQISGKMTRHNLSDLLPAAFGPGDLGSAAGLMASSLQPADLDSMSSPNDPFFREAMAAAQKSYAPYTQNFAGCAIKTIDGRMYKGRYVENAAFNPSLSALHTAIISMNMDRPWSENRISRAVLVEKPTSISQRANCELLLQTVAPNIKLEYFEAG